MTAPSTVPNHPGAAERLAAVEQRAHAELVTTPGRTKAAAIADAVIAADPLLGPDDVATVVARIESRMHGLGPLDHLLADEAVTDVLVNGPGAVWVERDGQLQRCAVELDEAMIRHLVERVVTPIGRRADRHQPIVDGRLPDGSRVQITMPPIAVDGPYVAIRRFRTRTVPVAAFTDDATANRLAGAVRDGRSILVCGGTGAGKTTLLNALAAHLPLGARIVTIEDAAELRLPGDHVVRLEARPGTADGLAPVTIRDLVRAALRLRPDRIVVGEVRGGEAFDLLQALNTGHRGSLSTCHANSPADALDRIESMAMTADVGLPPAMVRRLLRRAFHLVVHVERDETGHRRITDISRVDVDDRRASDTAGQGRP